jgi:hypothetical protein
MSDDLDSLLDSALDEYTTLSSNAAAQTSSNVNRSNANVNTNVTSATTDPSAAQVDAMAQEFLAT